MRELLVDDDNMKLEVEWCVDIPLLHLTVHKWSHNLLKNYFFPKWIEVQNELKSRGCHVVLALVKSTETKILKFHAIMGMHKASSDGEYTISRRWL